VVVGGEGSGGAGLVGVFVVPDRCGEGEEALQGAGGDAVEFLCSVAFEVELGFEGLVDGFNDLTERSWETLQWPGFLSFHGGSDEGDACVGEFGLKRSGTVALVRDEDLARAGEVGVHSDHVQGSVAFVVFG